MTRIHTLALESHTPEPGRFVLVHVAHQNTRRALKVALAEVAKLGGPWRLVHKTVRRSAKAMPLGQVLGVTGPFPFVADED